MPTNFRRVVRFAIAATMLLTLTGPVLEASAASDLSPGAPAMVSSATAPFASVKAAPDPAAAELVQIDNGIPAEIIAGPLTGADGLLWYQITVAGLTGYIAEIDLAWGAPIETEAPPVQEQAPPVVTGNGVVISADGSDIGCRVAPAIDAEWLFTYASGSSVDLSGQPVDGWQPVICANLLGYLPAELVYDPANLPTPEPTEVATEIVETPEATEIATETIPEVTETIEIPEATETVAIPEETETPDVVEPGAEETTTPGPTETIVEETSTPEITETAIDETGTPAATETAVTETSTPEATEIVGTTEPAPTEAAATVTVQPAETEIVEIVDAIGQTVSGGDGLVMAASLASAAVVYNTGAGGLRCRSGASLESPVLLVLPLGASVALTGPASNGWQPVVCEGQSGFMASRFLQAAEETSDGGDAVESTAALTGSTGVVQNTDGMGLRCRSGASLTASVITVLPEGTQIVSRGAASGSWQPITCAGVAGWVHTDYIGSVSSGGSNSGGSPGSTTGSAVVSGTNGDGVRFRAGASYDGAVIEVLMEGTSVTLRSGNVGNWTAVTYGGRNGFVYGDYLTTARNPSNPGSGSGVGSTALSPGSNARVTDTLNFRSAPSYSGGVVGVAAIGTVVRVTGSSSSGFYPVTWGGVSGYMHGDYLSYTTAALSTTGPNGGVGGNTGGSGAGSGSGSATGQSMVNYAMRYLGYPYVWATHGPSSFDCSGFTYWVVLNVTGRDIGAGTWTQWGTGSPVQYGNLQPGDLVFFQNTYTVGLSHVGMYIGNDQFIHAENENTGVRISSLTSTYYSTRYLGARR
ncbi:MAG TPA: SH3 domain-containing protein, partial [Thermomicrobiales bacterium]|nr:SH3 domain-containing protein [Thermomicrobiales bacterium]